MLLAAGSPACLAGRLAGARAAVRAALRMGLALALLIVVVNALVVDRGETVLARLGDVPILGQVDITLEAIVAGVSIGLRAAVTMVAFGVYSACVDPDRVLRALRPIAARSALTATLVSRLVPVAAADAGRLRDAAQLRGPGAAAVGRRAAGAAAPGRVARPGGRRRGDARAARLQPRRAARARGGASRVATTPASTRWPRRCWRRRSSARCVGADDFHAYPTIQIGLGPRDAGWSARWRLASGLAPRSSAAATGADRGTVGAGAPVGEAASRV